MNEILMKSFLQIAKDRVCDWIQQQGVLWDGDAIDIDVMDWHEGHGQAALSYGLEPFNTHTFYVKYDDAGVHTSVFDTKKGKYVTRNWNGKDRL